MTLNTSWCSTTTERFYFFFFFKKLHWNGMKLAKGFDTCYLHTQNKKGHGSKRLKVLKKSHTCNVRNLKWPHVRDLQEIGPRRRTTVKGIFINRTVEKAQGERDVQHSSNSRVGQMTRWLAGRMATDQSWVTADLRTAWEVAPWWWDGPGRNKRNQRLDAWSLRSSTLLQGSKNQLPGTLRTQSRAWMNKSHNEQDKINRQDTSK